MTEEMHFIIIPSK